MDFSPTAWSCSFCGTRGTEETRFIGGLGAMICADCLRHHHQKLSEVSGAPADTSPPWETMSDAEMLSKLPLIAAEAAQVDRILREWVKLIRARNISYAEIGKALGVSRQAAWERFSRVGADASEAATPAQDTA